MTPRTRLVGLLATLTVLTILIGTPAALIALDANPLPQTLPTLQTLVDHLRSPDDGTLLITLIQALAWIGWAAMALSILLETLARLRGTHTPRLPSLALPQLAARQLVGAATLLFITAPATLAVAGPSHATTHPVSTATSHVTLTGEASHPRPTSTSGPTTPAQDSYTVQEGDWLSTIAARLLGDPHRWPDLVAANPHLADNPDLIHPGTTLHIPTPTSTSAPHDRAYTVQAGDTLSGIAARTLDDPDRWPEIFTHNQNTRQPDGRYITDPDQIDIGQQLLLPANLNPATTDPATTDPATTEPSRSPAEAPSTGTTTRAGAPPATGARADLLPHPPAEPSSRPPATAEPSHQRSVPTVAPAQIPAPDPASPVPASTSSHALDTDTGAPISTHMSTPAWMLTGLTTAGALLAGSLLLTLRRARSTQARHRRPGHVSATPDPALHPVEKTITTIGEITAPTLTYLDSALRRLAATIEHNQTQMPGVTLIELSEHDLTLHLAGPSDPPNPWTTTNPDQRTTWTIPTSTDLDQIGPDNPDTVAPYPLLATLGLSDTGNLWLVNLEDTRTCLTGDTTRAADYARHIATEALTSPWSSRINLTCLATGTELEPLAPEHLTIHTTPTPEHLHDIHTQTQRTHRRAHDLHTDIPTARAHDLDADDWPAHLILIDATTNTDTDPTLDALHTLISNNPARTATCLLHHGTPPHDTTDPSHLHIHLTPTGRVQLPHHHLDLIATGLTSDETHGCALLLAQADDTRDTTVPTDDHATGWRSWTDHAGALRAEHTTPRQPDPDPHPENPTSHHDNHEPGQTQTQETRPGTPAGASSLLEHPDHTYTAVAATTRHDLHTLAPTVPATTKAQVRDADPTLDDDLAIWFHDNPALPKLQLLGPVRATTRGAPLVRRKPYMTELLAYIALHPAGVTTDQVTSTFGITTAKARAYIAILRGWLGTNPRTGEPHLPDARFAPAALTTGTPAYQVIDLLIDADLFRRLRLRGQARGSHGITDLTTALTLIQGRPFQYPLQRENAGGWNWLIDGDRHDQHLTVAIVDTAHIVTTHALATGDLPTARLAAETAILAAPDEEIPRLDLAAVATAEGNHAEAARIIKEQICNRTDDDQPPPEIPTRTNHILAQARQWSKAG